MKASVESIATALGHYRYVHKRDGVPVLVNRLMAFAIHTIFLWAVDECLNDREIESANVMEESFGPEYRAAIGTLFGKIEQFVLHRGGSNNEIYHRDKTRCSKIYAEFELENFAEFLKAIENRRLEIAKEYLTEWLAEFCYDEDFKVLVDHYKILSTDLADEVTKKGSIYFAKINGENYHRRNKIVPTISTLDIEEIKKRPYIPGCSVECIGERHWFIWCNRKTILNELIQKHKLAEGDIYPSFQHWVGKINNDPVVITMDELT